MASPTSGWSAGVSLLNAEKPQGGAAESPLLPPGSPTGERFSSRRAGLCFAIIGVLAVTPDAALLREQ